MMSCFCVDRRGRSSLKSVAALFFIGAGVALAGCSADVTRFDSASFNLNDPPETGSTPVPSEPVHTSALNDSQVIASSPRGPYGAGGARPVEMASLPDASPAPSYAPPPPPPPSYQPKPFDSFRGEPTYRHEAALPHAPATRGEEIEVRQGDTIYGLSRRYNVSIDELMTVNGLSNPSLRLGQKLYLPADGAARPGDTGAVAAAKAVEAARPAAVPLASASPDTIARYRGTYTVKPGDSLYGIAREQGVKVAELQQVNGISDVHRVKPGMTLKVPGRAAVSERSPLPSARQLASNAFPPNQPVSHKPEAPPPVMNESVAVVPPVTPSDAPAAPQRYGEPTTRQPTIINGERRVASLNDRSSDASPEAQPPAQQPSAEQPKPEQKVAIAAPPGAAVIADGAKLRWPAIGKIIAGFGGRPDGTHNDGINVSVPLGTDVHAAEAGVVAYAGSELKGYGNLVLLRHDNGWVTAYAHNDELLVKRGDKVKRGEVIAKAGKTGSVDRPQVHFELRQGSRPVDPLPYLEKL